MVCPQRTYIDSDPTFEAVANSLDRKDAIDQIDMSYSLKKKDFSRQKKHLWKVTLRYKERSITFGVIARKPDKHKIINDFATSCEIISEENVSSEELKQHLGKAKLFFYLFQDYLL